MDSVVTTKNVMSARQAFPVMNQAMKAANAAGINTKSKHRIKRNHMVNSNQKGKSTSKV
jgi:hypothetical protein